MATDSVNRIGVDGPAAARAMNERARAFNGSRPQGQAEAATPPRHVIAEYSSSAGTVMCTCGWQGTSAPIHGGSSPWSMHVAQFRPRRR